ncbi:MAG: hypothetical protein QG552_3260 [Thermodesulfobacteriota bacterium]|nr:hypothetical protein [Thermodesulfobacteriota bacterium]
MKRVPYTIFFILFSVIWIPIAGAESKSGAAAQDQSIQPQTSIDGEQIIPPTAGISWKERVMMWREIKKRAAASRNTLMREAAMERRNESRNPVQPKSQKEP